MAGIEDALDFTGFEGVYLLPGARLDRMTLSRVRVLFSELRKIAVERGITIIIPVQGDPRGVRRVGPSEGE